MMSKFDHIFEPGADFQADCEEIYAFQLECNPVYRDFCRNLSEVGLSGVRMPLLPVEAFRDARVYAAGNHQPELFFRSSGTTTSVRSAHHVAYAQVYRNSIFSGLRYFYPLDNMVVLGYTPGYSTNPHSSLVWMIKELISADSTGLSRFLEIGKPPEPNLLDDIAAVGRQVLLFGAAFGLADLAENNPVTLPAGSIVMETGGMKTYRREMSREELHDLLVNGFGVDSGSIHSEYGMTELLSQCYSDGNGWFRCPPWVKVSVMDPFNPLRETKYGEEGLIGIVDLANWASCPFLLTGDRGVMRADGAFKVLGRWSHFHLRGCNFMMEDV
jgi:hypothetical protein